MSVRPSLNIEENKNKLIPTMHTLLDNYPNPFNPSTTIHYEIIDRSLVELYIHDIYGNMIINLVKEVQLPGMRSIQWDANAMHTVLALYR